MSHHEILIVGGGTAGITTAAMLRRKEHPPQVTIVEPKAKHYYQPIWTLVGAGVFNREISERNEGDFIPPGVTWVRDAVRSFDPENKSVSLKNGETHTYEILVVAAGIQLDWDRIPGLAESVGKPGTGVCSNYAYETVDSTFDNIKNLKAGTALFTHPKGAVKCGGAPMKIAFLASDYWRKHGLLDRIKVKMVKASGGIFGIPAYVGALQKVADRYGIEGVYNSDLVRLIPEEKKAIFQNVETNEEFTEDYSMIHVTPHQSAPDFIKSSPLTNEKGWVEVDTETMQHVRYPEVFALGDCSSLPTSKTGAAIRKQAPVVTDNIMAYRAGRQLVKKYDGYTSCPLLTGYGSLILAEFDYNGQPTESFPVNQAQERFSMYALKAYGLPQMYWHGMLRGREF